MQRMTGIDPMFIYSDTPDTPMEIAYACVFDPSSLPGGYTFERVTAVLQTRIPTLQPFRRRLMPVPLGLDHPRWVDDPDFDLANHLHRVALPAPGGDAEFQAKVAQVMGRPLTPEQPPWEMHVVEGMADGTDRAHRQGAPFGGRRYRRRRDAGQAARPDRRGQRRHRTPSPVAPGRASLADAVDDRCAPGVHPQPTPGPARRTRDRPHGRAAGPLRHRRAARPGVDPPGRARHVRDAGGRRPGGVLCRARHGEGAGPQDALRVDHQRRRAGRLLGRAAFPLGTRTTRTSTARWSPSCRCRSGARRTARHWAITSPPCSSRSPTTRRPRWSGCAR